jgi:hypothetical protein
VLLLSKGYFAPSFHGLKNVITKGMQNSTVSYVAEATNAASCAEAYKPFLLRIRPYLLFFLETFVTNDLRNGKKPGIILR